MTSINDRLLAFLESRAATQQLRQLVEPNPRLIDFFSNDYLGLAHNQDLLELINNRYRQIDFIRNGSTGSRLLSGNSELATALERKLAKLFKAPKSLLFNSGYAANTAILSAVPQKGDTIIYDELIHASLKEGARLSFAKRFSFKHNDLQDLERKLIKAQGCIFIVIESVYSMDGDIAPLKAITTLADKYQANVILDEAHSTGIWGAAGNGLACMLGVADKIFARIYTFGKAMGVHGAIVVGSTILIDYLVNTARPFIYTTALPTHSLVSIESAFDYLKANIRLQKHLQQNIEEFQQCMQPNNAQGSLSSTFNSSPIQVVRAAGNQNARLLAKNIQKAGYDVRPVLSPTVKAGQERIRICLHVYNNSEQMNNLAQTIRKFEPI